MKNGRLATEGTARDLLGDEDDRRAHRGSSVALSFDGTPAPPPASPRPCCVVV